MYEKNSLSRRIPWWVGLLAFAAMAFLLVAFSFLVSALTILTGSLDFLNRLATPLGLTVQVLTVSALFSGVALVVPKMAGVPVKAWIRMVPTGPKVFGYACLGVLGLGFIVDEVTFLLHTMDPVLFGSEGLDLFSSLFSNAPPVLFLLLTLAVTLGPGIGEELLFRGLLLRSFLGGMAPWLAVFLSSLLFGVIHQNMLQGIGAGLIGLYLGFVALRTGTILPAMTAHALNNLICALFARLGGSMGTIWEHGHPAWVVVMAVLVFGAAMVGLVTITKDDARQ